LSFRLSSCAHHFSRTEDERRSLGFLQPVNKARKHFWLILDAWKNSNNGVKVYGLFKRRRSDRVLYPHEHLRQTLWLQDRLLNDPCLQVAMFDSQIQFFDSSIHTFQICGTLS